MIALTIIAVTAIVMILFMIGALIQGWRWLPIITLAGVILTIVLDNFSPALDNFISDEFIDAIVILALIFLGFMNFFKLEKRLKLKRI